MFRGFNLTLGDSDFNQYLQKGKDINVLKSSSVKVTLDSFFDNETLSASKITDNWFPQMAADVFISHSHSDHNLALALSGWLKENFNLDCFIDSNVWGYSSELLKKFDKKFCWDADKGTYDYDTRNKTTSHVNIMLATALNKMIGHCECVIFLNTPNSISCKGYIEETATYSPWIYSEILTTQIIRKVPKRQARYFIKGAMESVAESVDVKYDLDLSHLAILSKADLEQWKKSGVGPGSTSLDALYEMK